IIENMYDFVIEHVYYTGLVIHIIENMYDFVIEHVYSVGGGIYTMLFTCNFVGLFSIFASLTRETEIRVSPSSARGGECLAQ
ncbi:hypothetical protein VIGAN_07237700, partial [Vigna angularis var. angularis]